MKLVDFCTDSIRKDFKFKCDENLPKYLRLNSKGQFKVKVPADEFGTPFLGNMTDEPIGMSPLNYQQELQEAGMTLTTNSVKDFIKAADANNFNLTISDSLLATLKESKWWGNSNASNLITSQPPIVIQKNLGNEENEKVIKPGFSKLIGLFKKNKKTPKDESPKQEKEKSSESKIEVSKFFDLVKVETGKEKDFIERIDAYISLIKKSQALHQTAQSEKLIQLLINHVYESVVSVSGFNHYVTVEELSKLQAQCERVLDIDYISNFGRVIPDKVAALKIKADELGVFDNYLILHYNPKGETWKTEEEKRKEEFARRDPILFGIINNSNRLYKIADWVDIYCDLTWEDIIDKISVGDTTTEVVDDILDKINV